MEANKDDRSLTPRHCALTACLLLLAPAALAAPVDPAGFLGNFFGKAGALTDALIAQSTQLYRFSMLEWTAFTVCALVVILLKWTTGAAAVKDVLFVILMILISQSLMQSYDYVLAVLWQVAAALSDDINRTTYLTLGLDATGIDAGGAFLLDVINHLFERIIVAPSDSNVSGVAALFGIGMKLRGTMFLGIFFLVFFVVFAVSWIVSVIGLWGILLGKVLGPLFIPFLIFRRSNHYFDGWLNFMLASVVYFVVAQINVAFTILIMLELFSTTLITGEFLTLNPDDFLRLFTYAGLLLVSVYAMLRTDRVVGELMQGGLGMSGAISGAASMLSLRLVR